MAPPSLLLSSLSQSGLEALRPVVTRCAPRSTISGSCLQTIGVDAETFHRLLQMVFKTLFRATMIPPAVRELAEEHLFRIALVRHPQNVANPPQLAS